MWIIQNKLAYVKKTCVLFYYLLCLLSNTEKDGNGKQDTEDDESNKGCEEYDEGIMGAVIIFLSFSFFEEEEFLALLSLLLWYSSAVWCWEMLTVSAKNITQNN